MYDQGKVGYISIIDEDFIIGIINYEICLCLDKIGQITYLNFSRNYSYITSNFTSLDLAKSMGDSIINLDTIKYENKEIRLTYSHSEDDLFWKLFYYPTDSIIDNDREIHISLIHHTWREYDDSKYNYPVMEAVEVEEDIIPVSN